MDQGRRSGFQDVSEQLRTAHSGAKQDGVRLNERSFHRFATHSLAFFLPWPKGFIEPPIGHANAAIRPAGKLAIVVVSIVVESAAVRVAGSPFVIAVWQDRQVAFSVLNDITETVRRLPRDLRGDMVF